MVEFNGRLDALPCRLITALFFVAQIVYSGCVNLPERTGTDLITETDPFFSWFCNICINYQFISYLNEFYMPSYIK